MGKRWATLAVRAANSKSLDFSKAQRYDSNWNVKEALILREIERIALVDVLQNTQNNYQSLLPVAADPAAVKRETDNLHVRIGKYLLPWYDWTEIHVDDSAIAFTERMYAALKSDKGLQAELKKNQAYLNNLGKAAPTTLSQTVEAERLKHILELPRE